MAGIYGFQVAITVPSALDRPWLRSIFQYKYKVTYQDIANNTIQALNICPEYTVTEGI